MHYVNRLLVISLLGFMAACSTPKVVTETPKTPAIDNAQKQQPAKGAIDPKAAATYKQALNAIEQGHNELAVTVLTDMASNYPEFSGPQTNIGLIYFREGKLDKAKAAFNQAITINPANATAQNHLGIIHRIEGQFSEAEKFYLAAISHQPDYANAYLNLGILYDIYLIKLNKALQQYQKFQSLQQTEDSTVKKWIIGLQRRLKVSK